MMNNSNIINLSRRVKRAEEKLAVNNQGGIAEWAIKYARSIARSAERHYEFQLAIAKVLREQSGKDAADPEPPELRREENILVEKG